MSTVDPDDRVIAWQNHLVDYRLPTIKAVPLGADQSLRLPLPALALLLLSVGAGGLALKPRLLSRKAWAGTAVAGLVAATSLSSGSILERVMRIELTTLTLAT